MRRGIEPYKGQWAPPGGFVESCESLESAAAREVEEEVGISIPTASLIPHGLVSLPRLNQVYVVFVAVLPAVVDPTPSPPECLEAAWFLESEYPKSDIWDPGVNFDIGVVFERVRTRRLGFYQRNDASARWISHDDRLTYLWQRGADKPTP